MGLGVEGSRFTISGLGLKVEGLGLRVCELNSVRGNRTWLVCSKQ